MVLEPCGDKVRIKLNEDPPVNHCRPAVDVLFKSMSRIFGKRLLVSVLTGMGNDGLEGCRVVSQAGGVVFIQSQETCTVWGMPRAVYEAGLHDKVLALEDMGHMILHELHYYTQSAAAR
jgi:two-component system chemotaxis response regulator CheB